MRNSKEAAPIGTKVSLKDQSPKELKEFLAPYISDLEANTLEDLSIIYFLVNIGIQC